MHTMITQRCLIFALLSFLISFAPVNAANYLLTVQPVFPPEEAKKAYKPLADFLTKATGDTIYFEPALNFVSYWESMKKGGFDLVLGPAHFTDYRVKRQNYTVLAKFPDVVSFTLVTGEETLILEPRELVGKTVATLASPSLGALRLAEMFPNPLRQPVIVEVDNSVDAVQQILDGNAIAAIIPSPLVGRYPNLNSVVSTEQVPHMALSASPTVPKETREKIRKALLNADKTEEGKQFLKQFNIPRWEAATAKTYDGYASLLEGVWGY
jgi:ABC-type phosphate/phosphonate transport system substrate-binding protein